jgi:hypothetical protein
MKYLPGKKVVVPLFFVLVLIVVVFVVSGKETIQSPDSSAEVLSRDHIERIAEKDSDGDTLADWEEALWRTDPNNPDTDGDGISDGEEIDLDRNPHVEWPDDLLSENAASSGNLVSENEEVTLTEKFGRELFSGYVSLINNPRFQGDKTEVLYSLLDQNASSVPPATDYTLSDIRTADQNSNSFLRNYGNAMVTNFQSGGLTNEIPIIASIFQTENKEDKDKLLEIVNTNKEILNKNLGTVAPKEAELLHLALINSHNKVIDSLENILMIGKDPLVAVVGIGQYSNSTEEFDSTFKDFRKYFSINNIIFNQNEPGFVLNK